MMATNEISKETMVEIMLYELAGFNDEGVELSDSTIHNEVLSDSDGIGSATSKNIYRASIRWVLANNGYEDAKWPSEWMTITVDDLAIELLK